MSEHPPAELLGERVRLLPVSADRVDDIAAAVSVSLPELEQFMDWAVSHPTRAEDFAGFVEECVAGWKTGKSYNYTIVDRVSDEVIGGCGLMRRVGPGAIEIGYWIRSDRAGDGLATETARIITAASRELDDIHAVILVHDAANRASGRVAEKLGYVEFDRVPVELVALGDSGINIHRRLDL
jgi:RimJ/RimL family protein N-acetyltransferase